MEQLTTSAVAEDTVSLSTWFPIPGFGMLPINAYVIHSAQPVLVDTGFAGSRADFMAALGQLLEPRELAWIWLTHIDPDHIGNLQAVLAAAPNARVVTSFIGAGKLILNQLPVDRVFLLNPGQHLDVGDRRLLAVAPPVFDAPESTGTLDTKTGIFFSSDCFGGRFQRSFDTASDLMEDELREGMVVWASVDAPWLPLTDPARFQQRLESVRGLQPSTVLSSYLPPAYGMTDTLLANLAQAAAAPAFVGPDQAALEKMQGGAT